MSSNVVGIVGVLCFLVSLLLYWWENMNIVLSIADKARVLRNPVIQPTSWILRLALQYGGIIGVGFAWSWLYAVALLVIGYLFGKATFGKYYRREVARIAKSLYEGGTIDSEVEAIGEAREMITQRMSGHV